MTGTRALLVAFLCIGLFPAASQAQKKRTDIEKTIVVRVGEQVSIPARGVDSYSEGATGYADIRVTKDQKRFIIVGKKVGSTSLLMIMRDGSQIQYAINVMERSSAGLGARANIRLDFYFVLVQDRYSHSIGLHWPGAIGVGSQTSELQLRSAGGSLGGLNHQWQLAASTFLPYLDLAQSRGYAKIYRRAAVVTANGTEAVFNAGGEVNVQVQNNLTVTIKAIEFGTNVTVQPTYDPRTGRVELRVTADISDLSDADTAGIPGRTTSHVETLVNMQLGQAVSLAGIRAQSEQRTRAGIPGLGTIPFIGALFGSHQKRREDMEAYMFIVPSVVQPVSLTQRNRVHEAMKVYEDFRGGVDDVGLLEDPPVATSSPAPSRPKSKRKRR